MLLYAVRMFSARLVKGCTALYISGHIYIYTRTHKKGLHGNELVHRKTQTLMKLSHHIHHYIVKSVKTKLYQESKALVLNHLT